MNALFICLYALFTFRRKNFQWTNRHDVLLCREVLVSEPFNFKERSPERGKSFEKIAYNLSIIHEPKFRVTSRAVRDRYPFILSKQADKLRDERRKHRGYKLSKLN